MSINEATKANLRRKSGFVDNVQEVDGIPLFSWIDINITELCNRKCVFCPRVDESLYPNQNLNMSIALAEKIGLELKDLSYEGTIIFSGFGEPTLHPQLLDLIASLRGAHHLELVTNGDKLSKSSITKSNTINVLSPTGNCAPENEKDKTIPDSLVLVEKL